MKNDNKHLFFVQAVCWGHYELVKYFIEKDLYISEWLEENIIYHACIMSNVGMVKLLLENPRFKVHKTYILTAYFKNHKDLVKVLYENDRYNNLLTHLDVMHYETVINEK